MTSPSTVACGTGVTCTGFGGEGTGRKSQLDAELGAGPLLLRDASR